MRAKRASVLMKIATGGLLLGADGLLVVKLRSGHIWRVVLHRSDCNRMMGTLSKQLGTRA